MYRLLLLIAFLLAAPALAQPVIAPSVTTDKSTYAYGEPIEVRYTLANDGTAPFAVWGPSVGCQAYLLFDAFDSEQAYHPPCTLDVRPFEFAPGESATWVWLVDPVKLGLPASDGTHTITAYFDDFERKGEDNLTEETMASTTIIAPQYLGGRLLVELVNGVTLDDVQEVIDALNAIAVEPEPNAVPPDGSLWEITGTALDEAVAMYSGDDRFQTFEAYRFLAYDEVTFATDAESTPEPGVAMLTASYPNPFASTTSFTLAVPETGPARVEVFDILGRRVATLHDGPLTANVEHRFVLAANGLPSGLYVVRATGDRFSQTRRVTLSR